MSSSHAVFNGHRRVPPPINEPIRSYAPGTAERASLKARLKAMAGEKIDMPLIIGGKEVKTGACGRAVMPHDHAHVLGDYHKASEKHVPGRSDHELEPAAEFDPIARHEIHLGLRAAVVAVRSEERRVGKE